MQMYGQVSGTVCYKSCALTLDTLLFEHKGLSTVIQSLDAHPETINCGLASVTVAADPDQSWLPLRNGWIIWIQDLPDNQYQLSIYQSWRVHVLCSLPPPKKEVMFLVRSVCLSVCMSAGLLANLWTDFDEIFWRGRAWLRDQWYNFGDDPGHASDPGVQSPKSRCSGSAEVCAFWVLLVVHSSRFL